ncbi:hypothetical protein SAMN04487926_10821 [Paraburkholderia steynii]|uniref:Uncharacterized protein n=1 Tax=Paraburkholderia steynii TaxID=1245441 RepID=A0A7Z7FGX3_9BURK|nr:hypothetical protein SAMN04487926_10821 [Paraburkholderia steynii]
MLSIGMELFEIDLLTVAAFSKVYSKLHSPDPPPIEVLVERLAPALGELDETERSVLRSRARLLAAYAVALEKAFGSQ